MDMKLFDRRVVRRNIAKNLVSTKEYDRFIRDLPDLQGKCEPVEVSLFPADDEEKEQKASSEVTVEGPENSEA